jgi:hypothetical protein
MAYEIAIERAEPRTIASVRRRATLEQLPTVIPAACGDVWNFIRAHGIANPGRHVAVYREGGDGQLDLEVGAEVAGPFTGDARIRTSAASSRDCAAAVSRTTRYSDRRSGCLRSAERRPRLVPHCQYLAHPRIRWSSSVCKH